MLGLKTIHVDQWVPLFMNRYKAIQVVDLELSLDNNVYAKQNL